MLTSRASRLARSVLASSRRIAHAFAGRCRCVLRRHWLFAVVAGCAIALRAAVQLAYQPALIFPDSERYLQYARYFVNGHWSPDWLRTSGYSLLLMPGVLLHSLAVVAAVQHLLGLASAVLIYAVLVHFGARRWLAALATVPVLFDPLQLDIEQYVLTDVSAAFLLLAALVVLVWKRAAVGSTALVVAGLLIAAATVIRESDLFMMIPAVLYLLVVIRPGRRLAALALLLAGFLPLVLAYLGWHQVAYGRFDFVDYDSQFMYGRIAQFIDCTGVPLPGYERPLCPEQPPAQRNVDFYMWDPRSPQVTLQAPPGMNKGYIIQDFDRRILEHQPLTYLKAVANDVLYSFSPVRGDGPEHYPSWYHQFHPYFPVGRPGEVTTIRASTGRGPYVQPALASFLTVYGRDFHVPGPLLAAGLALGVAGVAGMGRARRSGLRAPCLLFTIGTIIAVEPPFIIATFDWRYELPQLSLIPIAAILGVTALAGRASDPDPRHVADEADENGSQGPHRLTGERQPADEQGQPSSPYRPAGPAKSVAEP
jgi:hypothetical protein